VPRLALSSLLDGMLYGIGARMSRLDNLAAVALRMYEGQVDKQGRPYSEHILAVTGAVSEEAKPVALFHDAIEDGRCSWFDVTRLLEADELQALNLLSRCREMTYGEYIERIAAETDHWTGAWAREVKIADLRHNLGRLTPDLESLRGRYERALNILAAPKGCTAPPGQPALDVRQTSG
jgi:(p)ppGpp synthase/HD superfamily hydrolase